MHATPSDRAYIGAHAQPAVTRLSRFCAVSKGLTQRVEALGDEKLTRYLERASNRAGVPVT